jgi:hypothetical protein
MTLLEKEIREIEKMIYVIRGQKVMLDSDLAKLYGVETKVLNQAVKRNVDRFPADFMFQLNQEEINFLRSDNMNYGGARYFPSVFTENGVAMLSSVLTSKNAIQINIAIMRTFTKLRSFLALENSLNRRMENIEENTTKLFKIVFERLDDVEEIVMPIYEKNRKKIGLKNN